MTDAQLIQYYLNNSDLLSNNNFLWDAARGAAWWILRGLIWLSDACRQLYDITFGLIDFTKWGRINTFVSEMKPLFIALLCLSIFALGIMLMFKHEKKTNLGFNICIGMLVVCCSTTIFSQLNELTFSVKEGIDEIGGTQGRSNVYQIASDHFYDLYSIDQSRSMDLGDVNYADDPDDIPQYTLTKEKLGAISINDVLDHGSDIYDFEDPDAKDILSQRLFMDGDGEYMLLPLEDGIAWSDIGNEFYYRYHVDWMPVLVELLSLVFVYIAMSWKCAKIVYELAFARCLAYLYAAEFSGGQKLGKILIFIRDSYILMLLTTLCLKLFYFFNAFMESVVDNDIILLILFVFSAFIVIDGPNLVEQLLGMDVGLQSSTARMVAAYHVAKGATNMVSAPARAGFSYYMQQRNNRKLADAIANATDKGPGGNREHTAGGSQNMDTSFMDSPNGTNTDPGLASDNGDAGFSAGESPGADRVEHAGISETEAQDGPEFMNEEADSRNNISFMDDLSGDSGRSTADHISAQDRNGNAVEPGKAESDRGDSTEEIISATYSSNVTNDSRRGDNGSAASGRSADMRPMTHPAADGSGIVKNSQKDSPAAPGMDKLTLSGGAAETSFMNKNGSAGEKDNDDHEKMRSSSSFFEPHADAAFVMDSRTAPGTDTADKDSLKETSQRMHNEGSTKAAPEEKKAEDRKEFAFMQEKPMQTSQNANHSKKTPKSGHSLLDRNMKNKRKDRGAK